MEAKASSIGFKSGEYAGRYNNRAAVAEWSDTSHSRSSTWCAHRSRFRSNFLHLGHGEWSSCQEQQHSASLGKGLAVEPGAEHER